MSFLNPGPFERGDQAGNTHSHFNPGVFQMYFSSFPQESDELRLAASSGPGGPPTNRGQEVGRGQDTGALGSGLQLVFAEDVMSQEATVGRSLLCLENTRC